MRRMVRHGIRHRWSFPLVLLAAAAFALATPRAGGADDDMVDKAFEPEGPTNTLVLPLVDPARGRVLFVTKGCVLCHAVNGVGGKAAPALDVLEEEHQIDPFAFMARMWRGANVMIKLQKDELGYQIEFEGDELAALIGFAYDAREQAKFTIDQVPQSLRDAFVDEPFDGWVSVPKEHAGDRLAQR